MQFAEINARVQRTCTIQQAHSMLHIYAIKMCVCVHVNKRCSCYLHSRALQHIDSMDGVAINQMFQVQCGVDGWHIVIDCVHYKWLAVTSVAVLKSDGNMQTSCNC